MGKAPRDVRYSRHEKTVVPANAQHDEQLTVNDWYATYAMVAPWLSRRRHTQQYTPQLSA